MLIWSVRNDLQPSGMTMSQYWSETRIDPVRIHVQQHWNLMSNPNPRQIARAACQPILTVAHLHQMEGLADMRSPFLDAIHCPLESWRVEFQLGTTSKVFGGHKSHLIDLRQRVRDKWLVDMNPHLDDLAITTHAPLVDERYVWGLVTPPPTCDTTSADSVAAASAACPNRQWERFLESGMQPGPKTGVLIQKHIYIYTDMIYIYRHTKYVYENITYIYIYVYIYIYPWLVLIQKPGPQRSPFGPDRIQAARPCASETFT